MTTATWDHLATQAAQRRAAGLRRELHPRGPFGPDRVDCASNDYLSLVGDPEVIAAACAATREWGTGSTASRLVSGALAVHGELEAELAALTGAAAGLLFSSGYLANIGAITALGYADTLILSDAHNHASIIDGCRLARGRVQRYPHRDVAAVAQALAHRLEPRALVVTDGVFSVDGEMAPLAELHRICQTYGAALLVDEAHAIGVVGPGGGGAVAAAGLAGASDVVLTLTLSKSLAAQGGAVLGDPAVIAHLIDSARTFIFDTGLAPGATAAALAAVRRLRRQPELAERVRQQANVLYRVGLECGWTAHAPEAAVVSLIVGDPDQAVAAQQLCAAHGVDVGCFRPPSVPDGQARLRLTAHAGMATVDVERIRTALLAARTAGPAPVGSTGLSEPAESPQSKQPGRPTEPKVLFVTGTSTGVGKTVVTAAICAVASAGGARVAMVKPAQTGVGPTDRGDVDEVSALAGTEVDVYEFVRYPDPLSPHTAARLAELPELDLTAAVGEIHALARSHDLVVVEGAGGVLVPFTANGEGLADLAQSVAAAQDIAVVIVADPALGTLNHTLLTWEALRARRLPIMGVVVGSWPEEPDLACRTNLRDLPSLLGTPLLGVLPAGAGTLSAPEFWSVARGGLGPALRGEFNGVQNFVASPPVTPSTASDQ